MSYLIVPLLFITLLLIFLRPKAGTFLAWLILFTYPHGWWYYHNFLPLNVGADDLFCILLFLIVLIKRMVVGSIPLRTGFAFWAITAFTFIGIIANLSGYFQVEFLKSYCIKDMLKNVVYWALFIGILHCIDDEKDLKSQFTMFSLAAVVGAILIIIQNYFPGPMSIFAEPARIGTGDTFGFHEESRGMGAFRNPNAAACVICCALVMVMTTVKIQKHFINKIIIYSFICILLAGLIFTRSRTGLLMLGSVLLFMCVIGHSKKIALLTIASAIMVGLFMPEIRQNYIDRFKQVYNPESQVVGDNVIGRVDTWKSYLETATLKDYLLGQGPWSGNQKNGNESHSAYISLLTVYGISGVLWVLVVLYYFIKKFRYVRKANYPFLNVIASGCLWALIGWAIYANTSDAISSTYPRYILFYIIILIDRVAYFSSLPGNNIISYIPELEYPYQAQRLGAVIKPNHQY